MKLRRRYCSEVKRPSGLVQDSSPEVRQNTELGGRLCFNAESDCGAGELLVRLLGGNADRDDDWVSKFEAAAQK